MDVHPEPNKVWKEIIKKPLLPDLIFYRKVRSRKNNLDLVLYALRQAFQRDKGGDHPG